MTSGLALNNMLNSNASTAGLKDSSRYFYDQVDMGRMPSKILRSVDLLSDLESKELALLKKIVELDKTFYDLQQSDEDFEINHALVIKHEEEYEESKAESKSLVEKIKEMSKANNTAVTSCLNDIKADALNFLNGVQKGVVHGEIRPHAIRLRQLTERSGNLSAETENLGLKLHLQQSDQEYTITKARIKKCLSEHSEVNAEMSALLAKIGILQNLYDTPLEQVRKKNDELESQISSYETKIQKLLDQRKEEPEGSKKRQILNGVIKQYEIDCDSLLRELYRYDESDASGGGGGGGKSSCLGDERVSHSARKEAVKLYSNPEEMFQAIKAAKRAQLRQDPAFQKQQLAALLAVDEAEESNATSSKTSQGGGSTKKGKKKKSKKKQRRVRKPKKQRPVPEVRSSASASAVKAVSKIDPLQKLVTDVIFGSKETPYRLQTRVKRWDSDRLTAESVIKGIKTFPEYQEEDEISAMNWIISHMGIGMHRILGHPELHRDFVYDSPDGPIMWCSVLTKNKDGSDGELIHGKLHFVSNKKNEVYHRMFLKATAGELEQFLEAGVAEEPATDSGDEEDVDEAGGPEELVGHFGVTIEGGNLVVRQPKHSYIKQFTIRSFK